jgi:hypothetical protein
MFDLVFLHCPYCHKHARSMYYTSIYLGLFRNLTCKHCNEKIILNHRTIKYLLISFLFAVIITRILKNLFSIQPIIMASIFFIITMLPIWLDFHLFAKRKT